LHPSLSCRHIPGLIIVPACVILMEEINKLYSDLEIMSDGIDALPNDDEIKIEPTFTQLIIFFRALAKL
ncbi:MAG: hypothetical protein QW769_06555, partial [Nitrososphaerales archaeon]